MSTDKNSSTGSKGDVVHTTSKWRFRLEFSFCITLKIINNFNINNLSFDIHSCVVIDMLAASSGTTFARFYIVYLVITFIITVILSSKNLRLV